jgi:hypothetical protein
LPSNGGGMSNGDQFFSIAQKGMKGRAWNGNKKQGEGEKRTKKQ